MLSSELLFNLFIENRVASLILCQDPEKASVVNTRTLQQIYIGVHFIPLHKYPRTFSLRIKNENKLSFKVKDLGLSLILYLRNY